MKRKENACQDNRRDAPRDAEAMKADDRMRATIRASDQTYWNDECAERKHDHAGEHFADVLHHEKSCRRHVLLLLLTRLRDCSIDLDQREESPTP